MRMTLNGPRAALVLGAEIKTAATAISGRNRRVLRDAGKSCLSVGNRTNEPRRVSFDKSIGGNVLGDYGTRRNNRVFAHRHSPDDRGPSCDPYVSFNHDGLCVLTDEPPN